MLSVEKRSRIGLCDGNEFCLKGLVRVGSEV